MINKVVLIGRITKDLEIRKTQSNASVLSYTLAVNRNFKKEGQQEADFISCVSWNQQADYLSRYAVKGSLVAVEGRIATRSYDGQNGKVYITEVITEGVNILDRRDKKEPVSYGSQAPTDDYQGYSQSAFNPEPEPQKQQSQGYYLDELITDDDLPFY